MRRMYSQAELSAIIKEVFLADVESGQIDLPQLIEDSLAEVDPSNLDFSGVEFKAKTLEQVQANSSLEFNCSSPAGLTITNIYNRFEVIGNILYIICNVKATNDTESSISLNGQISAQAVVTLPSAIAEKIYDMEGNPVSSPSVSAQAGVCATRGIVSTNVNFTSFLADFPDFNVIHPQQANVVYVGFRHKTAGMSVASGSSIWLTGRMALTLL